MECSSLYKKSHTCGDGMVNLGKTVSTMECSLVYTAAKTTHDEGETTPIITILLYSDYHCDQIRV